MFLFLDDNHDGLGGRRNAVGKGDVNHNGATVIVLGRGNLESPWRRVGLSAKLIWYSKGIPILNVT